MNKKSLLWSVMSLLVLASMLLSACGAPAATEAPAASSDIPAGDGTVTIFGGYGEAQTAAFQKALT